MAAQTYHCFLRVRTMLVKYKHQTHSNCPRCGQDKECTDHVLQCKGEGVQTLWNTELHNLKEWMQKQQIHNELIEVIIHNLNTWRNSKQPTYQPSNSTLQTAIKEQDNIGWNHFIEGFWFKNFILCQQIHFNTLNITKSTILLLSKTQRRIWQIAWQLWDH